jgi:arylsulfatase A-like enzyme
MALLAVAACDREDDPAGRRPVYDLLERFAVTEGGSETTRIVLSDRHIRPRLARGWSDPETLPDGEAVVVATERFATVDVDIARPADRVLVVRAARLGPPGTPPARIAVLLNRRRVGLLTIDAGLSEHRLGVPAKAQQPGRNELTISGPPRRRAGGIGVAYHSIRLEGGGSPVGRPHVEGDAIVLPEGTTLRYVLRVPMDGRLVFTPLATDAPPRVTVDSEDGPARALNLVEGGGELVGDLSALAGRVVRLALTAPAGTTVRLRAPRVLGPPPAAVTHAASPRANVLLYVIDTLRADHLGCYGYPRPTSPRIDALARDGVRFTDMLAQASWTRPATASILTGVDPPVHGAMGIRHGFRREVPTLAQELATAGYATAAFVTNVNVAGRWGFDRGFERYEYLPEDEGSPTLHVPSGEVTARAVAWLDAADPVRPFFLYLHASDPHAPYAPPDDLARAWAPPGACGHPLRAALAAAKRTPHRVEPGTLRALIDCYDAEIAANDRSLGALLDHLERRGELDDTVVVVTSDHGEEFLEHDGFEHGRTLYDEQLRVPLVLRLPAGRFRGRTIGARARQIDVMPTILDLLDLPIPGEVRGRSLLGVLDPRAEAAARRREPPVDSYAHTRLGGRDLTALTTGRWKVIETERARGDAVLVFDLVDDAGERTNSARTQPLLTDYARESLAAWRADLPRSIDPATGPSAPPEADEATLQRLRALGYVE